MGKKSRDKGLRGEREVVHICQEEGFAAERIPLSGAAGGSYAGDIRLPMLGDDWTLECKWRAQGYATIYAPLADNDALLIRRDGEQWLIVLPLRKFLKLIMGLWRRGA